ncbi:MAG: alpha/beta fold hydrolase [Nocardioidaceae bacterium]
MDRTSRITVGDVELFVREIGPDKPPAPPLVVIHGGPSWDHSYLLPGLLPVSSRRHVVAFDLRGCGRSSRDLGPDAYQPELVVEDLARLIRTLGHEHVDVIGFSTGGQVAQLFVEAYPRLVRRLVLASTTAYSDIALHLRGWEEYERRVATAPSPVDGLDNLATTMRWAIHGATTAIWNLDLLHEYLTLLDQVRFSGDWLEPFRAGRLHPWRPQDPERVLGDLDRPILILHGAQDMVFTVQLALRLHEAVPGSQLQVIEQSGHMAQFEQPERWSKAVIDFLTRECPSEPGEPR